MNKTREVANLVTENNIFVSTSDNRVGVGSTVPVSKLDVTGDVTADNFNSASDESMKSNITKIQDAIATLDRINGVSFTWKDTNAKSYGVTAQNVERVLPELVNDSGAHLTVNYNGLIGVLIAAVQEQQLLIGSLSDRLDALEGNS
jgi:hypothetical protein